MNILSNNAHILSYYYTSMTRSKRGKRTHKIIEKKEDNFVV